MGGSNSTIVNSGKPGVYGVQGTPVAANVPGGRYSPITWVDNLGNLWMLGGYGVDATGVLGYLNDLWEFHPGTRQWEWMGGSNKAAVVSGLPGVYGVLGTSSEGNDPGGRLWSSSWTDTNFHFWLFGGTGFDVNGDQGNLNDLWEYVPDTAAPVFGAGSGNYVAPFTVKITDSDPGAIIFYTLDGSRPNTSSTRYSVPFPISKSATVYAIAVTNSLATSPVSSARFNLTLAAPAFSVAGGTYNTPQTLTITDALPGATIYYSTNGATPTASSSKYTAPLKISSTESVEAIASFAGDSNSPVVSARYNLVSASPTFSPAPGTYSGAQSVSLADQTPGASIYYTTNGSVPGANSARYSGPIPVNATETIKAVAIAAGYSESAVATGEYSVTTAFRSGLSDSTR